MNISAISIEEMPDAIDFLMTCDEDYSPKAIIENYIDQRQEELQQVRKELRSQLEQRVEEAASLLMPIVQKIKNNNFDPIAQTHFQNLTLTVEKFSLDKERLASTFEKARQHLKERKQQSQELRFQLQQQKQKNHKHESFLAICDTVSRRTCCKIANPK